MYYYSVNGNEILKYEVSFDLEKVKELQENLFRDCSIERAGSYLCYGIPKRNPLTIYTKFEYKQVDVQDDFYGDRDIYQVEYTEIVKPKLYNLIDNIIAGDIEALKDVVMYAAKKPEDENARDINYYYYILQRMFKMRLVETLDVSIYNKVREFVGGEILKSNDLKLVLNKKIN